MARKGNFKRRSQARGSQARGSPGLTPKQRSAIGEFLREAGPYINRIFLRFFSELVTKPVLAAGRGARDVGYKALVEPTLNNIFNALGIPEEQEVRNSLKRYVYRSITPRPGYAVQQIGTDQLPYGMSATKRYYNSVVGGNMDRIDEEVGGEYGGGGDDDDE
jgi:hypothetical protein